MQPRRLFVAGVASLFVGGADAYSAQQKEKVTAVQEAKWPWKPDWWSWWHSGDDASWNGNGMCQLDKCDYLQKADAQVRLWGLEAGECKRQLGDAVFKAKDGGLDADVH